MMSDDEGEANHNKDQIIEDPKVTQTRHRCLVLGLLVVAALAACAIVLPLTIGKCDCPTVPADLRDTGTRAPVSSPVLSPVQSPTTRAPNSPPSANAPNTPTISPAPSAPPTTMRLGRFIEVYLIPIFGADAFSDTNSPQYMAAEFLANEDNFAPTLDSEQSLGDRYALVLFYYAMEGSGWLTCFRSDSACTQAWLDPDVNHCSWDFVGCDDTGRVVDLVFPLIEGGNGLRGKIPAEIVLLSSLQNFAVVDNFIDGEFPEEFGAMASLLRVAVSNNRMSGQIPEGFLADAPLLALSLSGNTFSGSIPKSFGSITTLQQLQLSDNSFSSTIPSELAALQSLGTLDLSGNRQLRGTIPTEIFSMASLERLYLSNCTNIQGAIPSLVGNLPLLTEIRLGGTGISGSLPAEIFNLPNLEEIDLTGGSFSGTLSEDFSKVAGTLRRLLLANNNFTGPVPAAFDNLTLLNVLQLQGNGLNGTISQTICSRRGDGRNQLQTLSTDCSEVSCSCCSTCF